MYLKLFLFIILLVNLGLPVNTTLDLILIFIFITILFFSKNIKISKIIKNKYIYVILIISFINFFIPKYFFNEGHSVFLTKNDLNIVKKILPTEISENIEKKFLAEFEFDRLENASDWGKGVHDRNFIKKPFAFSADNIFLKSQMSRYNSEINFKTREDLRIGQINSLNFNWPFDTQLRRELPYYIFLKFQKYFLLQKSVTKANCITT